jgi:hypothetical protein
VSGRARGRHSRISSSKFWEEEIIMAVAALERSVKTGFGALTQ